MEQRAEFETPEIGKGDMLFSLKDVTYTPETPRMNEPFIVKGKVALLTIPLVVPVWVVVTAEYPETWWEEIIPIIGAPRERESDIAIGGNFEVTFAKGFQREGEFKLTVGLYAGPTMAIDRLMLPPFPPVATEEITFTVSGKVTPWEVVEEILGIAAAPTTEAEAWRVVQEILAIAASPTTEVEAWKMVQEIPGIIATPIIEVELWEMIEEIPAIVASPIIEVEVWEVVEEIPNIVASPVVPEVGWGVVEEILGIVARPLVPVEYTLEVTIEPPGTGSVTKLPDKPTYSEGERVTLTAYPSTGYEFDHWGGWPPYPGVGSTSPTIQITMDANWWVVAVFREKPPPPVEYTLEVTIEPPGTGSVTKSPDKPTYSEGERVTLTAYPSTGYEFDHWGGWDGATGTSPTTTVTMDRDRWVVAVFREKPPPPVKYTLEVTIEPPGTGRVSISPYRTAYSAGERVTLTAYPDSGYEFDHWGGWPPYPGVGSTSPTIQITMDANWWVVAAFKEVVAPPEPTTYTVRVSTGTPGGTVSKSPDKDRYSYGEYVTVTAYPYMMYEFGAWKIDGAWSTSNPKTIRVTKDIVAAAYFEPV